MPKKANLQAVAKACAMSPMTVSRALRGEDGVAPEKARLAIETAERMGYRPRPKVGRPRAARAAESNTVIVVVCQAIAPKSIFTAELLVPLEQALRQCGCRLVIRTAGAEYAEFLALVQDLKKSAALATMVIGYLPEDWLRSILEAVPRPILIDHTGDPLANQPCDSISFDYIEAARMAVTHLVESGRRRIALIAGAPEHYFSRDIETGYRDALRRAGIAVDEALIRYADFSAAGAMMEAARLLESESAVDAIFTNDEMALGVQRFLNEQGIAVPERIALVGCDGLPFGEYLTPSLTTMAVGGDDLGRVAADRVTQLQRAPDLPPCRVRLLPKLVLRESSRKD